MGKEFKELSNEEWSRHYNLSKLNNVIAEINSGNVSVWSRELINITRERERILEIGCGSGASSLWLAKNKRKVTALDYTESSIALAKAVAEKFGDEIEFDAVIADATKPLPFKEKQFDMAFQSGLLEHFSTEEQIELLKNWKKYCERMVSMIPNKASIPYRVGKKIMEENDTWEYGLEIPKHSMAFEFEEAGISVIKEYTIGTEWALKFLPKKHYIRKFFMRIQKEGIDLNDLMQGYLIVTIGKCI